MNRALLTNIAIFATTLALPACTHISASPPNYAAIVGMVQTDYPQVKAAAATYCASKNADSAACAKIAANEAVADPLVAALTATTAPTTIQAALQDVVVELTAPLPAGSLSPQTMQDLTMGLTIATTAVKLLPLFGL